MEIKNIFKSFIFLTAVSALVACSETYENISSLQSGKIMDMPSSVSAMNVELERSRVAGELKMPTMHNHQSEDGKMFCRFTSIAGINANHNTAQTTNKATSRGISISTNSFYDSYDLYTYIHDVGSDFNTLASSGAATLTPTYPDEEIKKAMNWKTPRFWPGDSEKCTFIGYAPYHAVGVTPYFIPSAWPKFKYEVPNNVLEQSDLLVTRNEDWDVLYGTSGVPGTDYANINVPGDYYEPDSIRFDHACTAVRFALGDKMAPGTIKKIELIGVYARGEYWYQDEQWHNVDSVANFVLEQDFEIKKGESNKLLNNSDNIFMMIPQTTPTTAAMQITIDDGEVHIIKASIRGDVWRKGHTVTYYLSTDKDESSYVLAVAPSGGDVPLAGGTKNVTINSYKESYYGTQTPVPWTAEYSYEDENIGPSGWKNSASDIVTDITLSGNGSSTSAGELNAIQIARQVERSKSWRSTHTATLRSNASVGTASSPHDLAAGKRTANCYVISAPGHYKFPLVYGNALNADGSSNNDSYGTETFVDHQGVQIDNPYIYLTNGSANVPDNACIVWQDAPHLVTPSSVKLDATKHYIEFEIERKNICAGNCVIAVRDASKTIMWSWHIWVTDHDINNTIEVHNNPSVGGSVISDFMEVPLGWCDAETRIRDKRTFKLKVTQTETGGATSTISFAQNGVSAADSTYEYGVNAPYYQWGRKDPMLPSNGMGNIDKPYYDNQNPWLRIGGFQATNTAIQNPFTFYTVSNNDWSSTHNYDYWNKNFTSDPGITNAAIAKTIYSPSPSGYVEPKTAAFTGFTLTGGNTTNGDQYNVSGSFNKGWNFYTNGWRMGSTIFFEALGYRDTYNNAAGVIVVVGIGGNYWLSGPSSTSYARFLSFYSNFVDPQFLYSRSYGFVVRPVKE